VASSDSRLHPRSHSGASPTFRESRFFAGTRDAGIAREVEATAHWHLRARWWAAGAALALVAIAVVLDLPTHASQADRQAAFTSWTTTLAQDVAQCSDGVRDAITAHLSSTEKMAATFTQQARSVCSFANSGVVDLASTQPPRDVSSPTAARIAPAVARWAGLDALEFLQDLAAASPARASARHALLAGAAALDRQRGVIEGLVRSAERELGLPAKPLPLVQAVPMLLGAAQ
jgi:hypothetical protein